MCSSTNVSDHQHQIKLLLH